ncbi:uncharacterized protein RSE6_07892 [Rhynchosporium secalis]|uniref:Haloacid dehalogenase-like hydrolase n=1 Tax=Rhynchosporium secalis TaxID=38038 RepID=A0A1E1MF33_RHYSE|nr:uncharacterized protein RSE6_07892 [Rhynchosporium secalis]
MSNTAFILDFDGTITHSDTISLLAKFGISTQKSQTGKDMTNEWRLLSYTYSEFYSRSLHGYRPAEIDRKSLAEEITFQRHLRGVELPSFKRVGVSGIFKGIKNEQWREFAGDALEKRDLSIRAGFKDFVKQVEERDGIWGVVSVNFSEIFIRGVLEASASAGTLNVDILANHPNDNGMISGPDSGPIMATSDAKLAAMNKLWQKWRATSRVPFLRVVYFGDSGTDIECLTAEGVTGIVMSSDGQGRLIETLKRIGRVPVHVSSSQEVETSPLYWARNFQEVIESPLLGLEAS